MRYIYLPIHLVTATSTCNMTMQEFASHVSTARVKSFEDTVIETIPEVCVDWLTRTATKISRDFPKATAATLRQLNARHFNKGYIPWYIIFGVITGGLVIMLGSIWCCIYTSNNRSIGLVIFGALWVITFALVHLSSGIYYNWNPNEPNLLQVINNSATLQDVRDRLLTSLIE